MKYQKIVKLIAIINGLQVIRALLVSIPCLTIFAVPFAISYSNEITPKGIVIHHSAVPFINGAPIDIKAIDAVHKSRGFSI